MGIDGNLWQLIKICRVCETLCCAALITLTFLQATISEAHLYLQTSLQFFDQEPIVETTLNNKAY